MSAVPLTLFLVGVIKPRANKTSGRRNWRSEMHTRFQFGNLIRIVRATNRKREHIIKFYS